MMNYSSRASPKLRYSIIEEYGGRGHRTRLRNDLNDQLVCLEVPLPPYIKEPRGRGPPARRRAQEESYSYRE